jgi:hypothetical protein
MKPLSIWNAMRVFVILSVLQGCAARSNVYLPYSLGPELQEREQVSSRNLQRKDLNAASSKYNDWTVRVVKEEELLRLRDHDAELTLSNAWEILARLNTKASYYISHDIENRAPLKVPKNFSAYKTWTPLPRSIPELAGVPKFILIVKDVPFLGWYEKGKLMGDSQICIGKEGEWTRAGLYAVKEKDVDHTSRSYSNAFGQPSPMPYGMRVYEHVWIHGGDLPGGYCSHGCVNLPLNTAERVFQWSDARTAVLIVETLGDLPRALKSNQSSCVLYATQCASSKTAVN